MRYGNKEFNPLPTDVVELATICGLTAPKYIRWNHRGTVAELFKKYNRARGKVSKQSIVDKLSTLPKGEYAMAVHNLIAYVESETN